VVILILGILVVVMPLVMPVVVRRRPEQQTAEVNVGCVPVPSRAVLVRARMAMAEIQPPGQGLTCDQEQADPTAHHG
jgi:hypothetical protein